MSGILERISISISNDSISTSVNGFFPSTSTWTSACATTPECAGTGALKVSASPDPNDRRRVLVETAPGAQRVAKQYSTLEQEVVEAQPGHHQPAQALGRSPRAAARSQAFRNAGFSTRSSGG